MYLKSTVRNYLHVAKSISTKNTLFLLPATRKKYIYFDKFSKTIGSGILTRPDPNSIYQQPYDLFWL